MTRIAIMQPYFMPYAGYFRLFLASDLFVVYDCVQFPRRGYVHRNQLSKGAEKEWLSLPLKKQSREVLIKDLKFHGEAEALWLKRINDFPIISAAIAQNQQLKSVLLDLNKDVIDYLIDNLRYVCAYLNIGCNIVRSSELKIDKSLKAQDRIIAIVKELNGTEYINASGGVDLYDDQVFKRNNIDLKFLQKYSGSYLSILESICKNEKISEEIRRQSRIV